MIHFIFMVEEPSAEKALNIIVPKLIGSNSFEIINFNSKQALLGKLPGYFKGMSHWIPENFHIIILVDQDNDNCFELKERMEEFAVDAGFITKSSAGKGIDYQVVNRIAVEELEAWFFGDIEALRKAFPRLPDSLAKREKYRYPDRIRGGTWESLFRLLKENNYYNNYFPKIEVAGKVAENMEPARNKSRSFQVFRDAILEIVEKNNTN